MPNNPTHLWWLMVLPEAQAGIDRLPKQQRQQVFKRLRELLILEDPYMASGIEMLKDKQFERARRVRVGDYRLIFFVIGTEATHLKHTYKGTFYLLGVSDRKDAYKP